MQRHRKIRIPSYRLHKPSGQAVVTIRGRDHYLGPFGSGPSRTEYDRLIAEYLAGQTTGHAHCGTPADLTVAELCSRYVDHAEQYYVKRGRPTSEIHTIRKAVKTLRTLYEHTLADEFGPLALKTCRTQWVDEGLTRRGANRLAQTIRAIFKWGTENEIVRVTTWQALTTVAGLKRGRTPALDPDPVRPVPEDHLNRSLNAAHPMIQAMIRIQLKSGMRPGELILLRGADIDTSRPVWVFTPLTNKLEHQGRERIIHIGPEAQAELKPWLRCDPWQFIFGPRHRREYDLRDRLAPRPRTAWEKRNRKRRVLRSVYTVNGYLQAIRRTCDRAGVTRWTPNQLRHNAGTLLRAKYGVEAARTVLGHSNIGTTQIYAEADLNRAAEIIGEIG